jgi:hypothetical protein
MEIQEYKKTICLLLLVAILVYITLFKRQDECYENTEHLTIEKSPEEIAFDKAKKELSSAKKSLETAQKKLNAKKTSSNKKNLSNAQISLTNAEKKFSSAQYNLEQSKKKIIQPPVETIKTDTLESKSNLNKTLVVLEEENHDDHLQFDTRISNLENQVEQVKNNNIINGIKLSKGWTSYPDDKTDGAEISNDINSFKTLMIVGNKSAGSVRKVGIWDQLDVHGNLNVDNSATAQNGLFGNIKLTKGWTGYPDNKTDGAEISNDVAGFKELMIVGNKSAGGSRKVGVWDKLTVHGELCIDDVCINKNDLLNMKKNKLALRSSFGKYCSIQPNGSVMCDRTAVGPWETLNMEKIN